jgi:hypothetical protein
MKFFKHKKMQKQKQVGIRNLVNYYEDAFAGSINQEASGQSRLVEKQISKEAAKTRRQSREADKQ